LKYVIRRIIISIPIIIGITLIVFSILHLAPGDPVKIMLGQRATPELVEKLRHEMGLDKPIYVQYFTWLSHVIKGDLGKSLITHRPVLDMIVEKIPATLELTIPSLVISALVSVFLGIMAALHRGSWIDQLTRVFALVGVSIPSFWFALILLMIFSFRLGWLPIYGRGGPIWTIEGLKHAILPITVLSLTSMALLMRVTRSAMVEVLEDDYIRTAKGKGLPEKVIIYKHALRNALIPVVTILALRLAYIFGGAVIVETIFAWPGMGRLIVSAIYQRDFPVVQGVTLMFGIMVMIANLIADILYAYLDPRISYE